MNLRECSLGQNPCRCWGLDSGLSGSRRGGEQVEWKVSARIRLQLQGQPTAGQRRWGSGEGRGARQVEDGAAEVGVSGAGTWDERPALGARKRGLRVC